MLLPRDEEAEEEENKGEAVNSPEDFQRIMKEQREIREKENGV
jgi:hypothetical protein